MRGTKGYGFLAVLVKNSAVSILVWFLQFSLDLGMFLEEATF